MRQQWLVALSLVACIDPIDKDPDSGQPEEALEPDLASEVVECATRTLDFELSTMLSGCQDPACNILGGPWRGDGPPAVYYDVRMTARCFVEDVVELTKGVARYRLLGCSGQQVPRDGAMVLTWQPSQPLPLPLAVGQIVDLRYRALGSDRAAVAHHGLSISDESGRLLAYHSAQSYAPDPWLVEPLALEVSHQDCTPLAQCGGTAFRDQITIRTPGQTITVPDGTDGTFVTGDKIYDAFVFEARSGSGFACGASGTTARYELAVVAR